MEVVHLLMGWASPWSSQPNGLGIVLVSGARYNASAMREIHGERTSRDVHRLLTHLWVLVKGCETPSVFPFEMFWL